MARALWTAYLNVLGRRPLATQMAQTSVLMGAGDLVAQLAIEKREEVDPVRTARFAAMGMFFVAPVIRGWYLTMERLVPASYTLGKQTLMKVTLDQAGFAPLFQGSFLTLLGALQGNNLQEVNRKLRQEYMDVLLTNWKVWPGVQLVNFFFVPFLLRPLVVSFVALFWNTYLSWKTNQTGHIKSEESKE